MAPLLLGLAWIHKHLEFEFRPESLDFHAFPPRSMAEGVSLLESPSRFKQTRRVVFQDQARAKRGEAVEHRLTL